MKYTQKISFLRILLRYIKHFCFTLLMSSLFLSCSQDMYEHALPVTQQQAKESVSFSDFKRITGWNKFQTKLRIPHYSDNHDHGLQAKTAEGEYEFSDFVIDTSYIRKIVVDDKITYTFWVTPKVIEKRSMFNLMVYKEDDRWDMSIIEFVPSDDFIAKYEAGISTKIEGMIRHVYTSREPSSERRISIWITYYHCTGTGPCADGVCDMCSLCVSSDVIHIGNPGPDFNVIQVIAPTPSSGNDSGGGGISLSNPYNYPFGENFPDPNSKEYLRWKKANSFWNGLSSVVKEWINSNPQNTNEYLDILEELLNANVHDNNTQAAYNMIAGLANGTLISVMPTFKYPINSNYESLYPEFTYLVKEEAQYLRDNKPQIAQIISNLTGLSTIQVKKNLTWGAGPIIVIEDLGNDANGNPYHGKFKPSEPDKIFIDKDLVEYLENYIQTNGEAGSQTTPLRIVLLYSVVLHELTHYSDFSFDQLMQNEGELGLEFEQMYMGGFYEFNENNQVIFIRQ